MMNWISLAILGLILTFLAFISFCFRYGEKKRRDKLGDTDTLRKALASWEPIVLEHEKTLRGVKRFANRARFLTIDEAENMIPLLVGCIALDEIGFVNSATFQFDNESDFRRWNQENIWRDMVTKFNPEWTSTFNTWRNAMTLEHWNRYRTLAELGRSQSGESSVEAKSTSDTTGAASR